MKQSEALEIVLGLAREHLTQYRNPLAVEKEHRACNVIEDTMYLARASEERQAKISAEIQARVNAFYFPQEPPK